MVDFDRSYLYFAYTSAVLHGSAFFSRRRIIQPEQRHYAVNENVEKVLRVVTHVSLASRAKVRDAITVHAAFITSRESSQSLLSSRHYVRARYLGFQVPPSSPSFPLRFCILSLSPSPPLSYFCSLCSQYYDACSRAPLSIRYFLSACTCTWMMYLAEGAARSRNEIEQLHEISQIKIEPLMMRHSIEIARLFADYVTLFLCIHEAFAFMKD